METKEKDIKKFLETQRGYTLFKQTSNVKERNPYKVFTIDQVWELDLISLPNLAQHNNGIVHLLVCIDVFSRFAFVRPLRNKKPSEVVKALIDIFKTSNRKPVLIQTDAGKEFTGSVMKNFLQHNNIQFRMPKTTLPAKCAVVERFNRTLKQRISRYLMWKSVTTEHDQKKYINVLPDIIDDYNRTRHSVIQTSPQNVTKANSVQLYEKLRKRWEKIPAKTIKLWVGDYVRVKRKKDTFQKESNKPLWSTEIFKVTNSINRHPYPVYEITDLKGRPVDGKLYERELQKVELPMNIPIEILKSTKNIFNKHSNKDNSVRVRMSDGKIKNIDLKNEKKNI